MRTLGKPFSHRVATQTNDFAVFPYVFSKSARDLGLVPRRNTNAEKPKKLRELNIKILFVPSVLFDSTVLARRLTEWKSLALAFESPHPTSRASCQPGVRHDLSFR